MTRSLYRFIAVLAVILLLSACGKGNPIQPDKTPKSLIENDMVLGVWGIEVTGLGRGNQVAQQPPYEVLVHILVEDPVEQEAQATLEVSTQAFDREAQLLSLNFKVTNNSLVTWYEPWLVIDFDESAFDEPTDLIPDEDNKNKPLLYNADAHSNILALLNQGDPDHFDPYKRLLGDQEQDGLFPDQEMYTTLQIQIPDFYLDEVEDQICHWSIWVLGSHTITYYQTHDVSCPDTLNLTPGYSASPYDITDQCTQEPVIELDTQNAKEFHIRCDVMTHFPNTPILPDPNCSYLVWTNDDYTVQVNISDLTGNTNDWKPLDRIGDPTGNHIPFYNVQEHFLLATDTQPGVYWIPIRAHLELPAYEDFYSYEVPNPTIQDVIRVVVTGHPGDHPESVFEPAGYRVFYLSDPDGLGIDQISCTDTLTHQPFQLTYGDKVISYDVDESGDNIVFGTRKVVSGVPEFRCYWLSLANWDPPSAVPSPSDDFQASTDPIPEDGFLAYKDPRISADGKVVVFVCAAIDYNDPNWLDPLKQDVRALLLPPTGFDPDDKIELQDYYLDYSLYRTEAKLSLPSVGVINSNPQLYVVLFGTDYIWPSSYLGAGIQLATFVIEDDEFQQTGITGVFRGGACFGPVISPWIDVYDPTDSYDQEMFVYTAGVAGNEDVSTVQLTIPAASLNFNPDTPEFYEDGGDWCEVGDTMDDPPLFAYYPEIAGFFDTQSNYLGHRISFRQGNNKNSEVEVWFTGIVPPGLGGLPGAAGNRIPLTDISAKDDASDLREYQDWPDISPDGGCVVFMSASDTLGDIFYVDISELWWSQSPPFHPTGWSGDYEDHNLAIWRNIRRLTLDGTCTHPRVSGRIAPDDLP